jgi:hypothetical protein
MATVNLKVLIRRPGGKEVTKLSFQKVVANDVVRIPRRTPYADIANLQELKDDGFIRSANTNVSTELGGSNTAGAYSKLGLTLPRTEKLILIAKNPAATKVDLTISGNNRAGYQAKDITLPAGVAGDLFELDLFDLGFHFEDNEEGSMKITAKQEVDLVLIARF